MPNLSPTPVRRARVALLTAIVLVAPPVRAAGPAAKPSIEDRFKDARDLYAKDQYILAADRFEALHADTRDPLYLYYAGLSREGAGHDAHAIAHWQQALATGLDPAFTAKARARIDQARARTTPLTIVLVPAALAATATATLSSPAGHREPFTVPLSAPPLHLEPGEWTATITPNHPAFEPQTLQISVSRGAPAREQKLEFKAIEHPVTFAFAPPDAVKAGLVLTLRDPQSAAPERQERPTAATATLRLQAGAWDYTLAAPGYTARAGTLTVTANTAPVTLDLAPSAGTTRRRSSAREPLIPPKRTRTRLALGLGLGAVAPAVAGVLLTGLAAAQLKTARANATVDPATGDEVLLEDDLDGVESRLGPGTMLLGGGGGFLVGSLVAALPARRPAWFALLGSGLAVGGVGVGIAAGTRSRPDKDWSDPDGFVRPNDLKTYNAQLIPASVLFGLGTGVFVSAVAALITARANRQNSGKTASISLASNPVRPGFTLRF